MIVPFPFSHCVPSGSIYVSREAEYFTVSGGEKIELKTKCALRKIFRAIVQNHRDKPSRGLSVDEVFRAGWGDEIAEPDAMAGRVYSAMSKLRRLGLGDVLQRTEAGYLLDPRCLVIEETRPIRREEVPTVLQPVVPQRLAS